MNKTKFNEITFCLNGRKWWSLSPITEESYKSLSESFKEYAKEFASKLDLKSFNEFIEEIKVTDTVSYAIDKNFLMTYLSYNQIQDEKN